MSIELCVVASTNERRIVQQHARLLATSSAPQPTAPPVPAARRSAQRPHRIACGALVYARDMDAAVAERFARSDAELAALPDAEASCAAARAFSSDEAEQSLEDARRLSAALLAHIYATATSAPPDFAALPELLTSLSGLFCQSPKLPCRVTAPRGAALEAAPRLLAALVVAFEAPAAAEGDDAEAATTSRPRWWPQTATMMPGAPLCAEQGCSCASARCLESSSSLQAARGIWQTNLRFDCDDLPAPAIRAQTAVMLS